MAGSRGWGKLKLCTQPPQMENTRGRLRVCVLGKALAQYGLYQVGEVRGEQGVAD